MANKYKLQWWHPVHRTWKTEMFDKEKSARERRAELLSTWGKIDTKIIMITTVYNRII